MEDYQNTVKNLISKLTKHIEDSGIKINKFNFQLALEKGGMKFDMMINSENLHTLKAEPDAKPDDKQEGGFFMSDNLQTISSDNTLSTSIFKSSYNDDTEIRPQQKQSGGNDLNNSITSEMNTVLKGGNIEYSATSVAYSMKGGDNITSSDMGTVLRGGNVEYSATSLDGYSMKGGNNVISSLNTEIQGGFSELGQSETNNFVKPFKKAEQLSTLDRIKQKIKELENSDSNVFKKTQSGGKKGDDRLKQIKQATGINSSSTNSLCE
jgi:hypothetical protein